MANNKTKKCSTCKEEKDLSLFTKYKKSIDGVHNQCRACRKKYNIKNKDKISKKNKEWRENNPEKKKLLDKKYQEKNRDKLKEYNKIYYIENIEKFKIYNKEYCSAHKEEAIERVRRYRETPKGKSSKKNYEHKRRTEKRKGDVSTNQLLELIEKSSECYWCKESLSDKVTHIDHLVPLSRGGLHTISNLRVTCSKCNLKKGNKTPEEYLDYINRIG